MKFTAENQPQNRGRKPTGQQPTLRVSLSKEAKEFYQKRKGLAGMVLEEYKSKNEIV